MLGSRVPLWGQHGQGSKVAVIPKFSKKVGDGNGNSNHRNAVEQKKIGKKVSKFLLKDSRKNCKYYSNFQ